jgi:thiol-disulfide isomerase/thioredoxin
MSLALIAFPMFAQQSQEPKPNPEPAQPKQYPRNPTHDPMGQIRWDNWEDKAQRRDEWRTNRLPPEVTPNGWFNDYDYQSNLGEYLDAKYQHSLGTGKNVYIYLYADWYEPCKAFRKSINSEDYAELFLNNEIIMVDYAFFNWEFETQIEKLPLFIKVNDNGLLGPESFRPVTNEIFHPRRAYYNLEKFFKREPGNSLSDLPE